MDAFKLLEINTRTASDEEDLPDFLTVKLRGIVENRDQYADAEPMVRELAAMVADFNTYAEACCERLGTTATEIDEMIMRITGYPDEGA